MHARTARLPAIVSALLLALSGTPSHAQPAGHYVGLTAQGRPISLDIAVDADGTRRLNGMTLVMGYQCPSSHAEFSLNHFLGVGATFNRPNGFERRLYLLNLYGEMQAEFDRVDTFHGTISATIANFLAGDPPTQAENCLALDVGFDATLVPGEQSQRQ